MDIRYSKQAAKYLRKLQPALARRIPSGIQQVADGRTQGLDIKPLQGVADAFRMRIGDYRVIYEIRNNELVLIVIKVGARGDVYK